MSGSHVRELQRQFREMEDRLKRRLIEVELNLQSKINCALHRVNASPLFVNDAMFGLGREPVVLGGLPLGPSTTRNNRNNMDSAQNMGAMGAMNASRDAMGAIDGLRRRGGGIAAMLHDLDDDEREARDRRREMAEDDDYQDWVDGEQELEVDEGFPLILGSKLK